MELSELIAALSEPSAYPHPVERVEVRQTHISAVFLAGPAVYKVKKPVALGFLDFSTLERRRHFCGEEVRLNRRLAPAVYHGVVPVARAGNGLRLEGEGEPVEWAVKMARLPADATLRARLLRGDLDAAMVEGVARRVAAFHAAAAGGPHVAAFGRFDVVAGNARDNLEQARPLVGVTLSQPVFDRLAPLHEEWLTRLRPLVEARAARGVPRDGHGDLHLDHVYLFPDRPPPDDLLAIDCVEFGERFRCADPVADMAFLAMDLRFHGRPDLADAFADAYFAATGDAEGRALLPFYAAYRAAVRAKVEGLKQAEPEVHEEERRQERDRARAHWLLALGLLEAPARRPALALVAGLPGGGKSTLAAALAQAADFERVRSDVVRAELAGPNPKEDIYTPEWNQRTYAECLRRAGAVVLAGGRAVVDANFRRDADRAAFLAAATTWGVPGVLLLCRAAPEAARRRLAARQGDASDADWRVYQEVAAEWEEPGPRTRAAAVDLDADRDADDVLRQALAALRGRGL